MTPPRKTASRPEEKPSVEAEASAHLSLAALAEAAGVSVATASRAMRDHCRVSLEVRRHVQAVAEKIGYRPNPLVASLMHQIRERQVKAFQGVVAMIGCASSRAEWERNAVARLFWAGVEAEAKRLGFQAELLLPRAEGLPRARLAGLLRARGIVGAVLLDQPRAHPDRQELLVDEPVVDPGVLPLVLVGHKHLHPTISFAMSDQYANARRVGRLLWERGYRRPLLFSTRYVAAVTENRFEAGLAYAGEPGWLAVLHSHALLPPGLGEALRSAFLAQAKEQLLARIRKHRADVVVSVDNETLRWMREAGLETPGEIGFASLDWCADLASISGIEQRHEVVGAVATRRLAELVARNESGPQEIVSGLLVEGAWREGATLRAAS